MANRTVTVKLEANPTGLLAGLATARKSVTDFGGEMDRLAVKSAGSFSKLTNTGLLVGGALTAGFGLAVKAAYDFDKQMSAVGAVADASGMQLANLRQAAIDAGKGTAFTATQAAQAEEELAKAGVSTSDILSGALKGSLSLAAAGSLDLADAATIASQAMNQFGLKGAAVGHIADVLTAGANKSATDVQALGESLGQVGSVAHQAGMGLDETVGVLAAFAQQGLVGEEAGTTFKTMLLKLENPSAKAATTMQQLGLNVYDAQGHFLSAAGLADALQKSLGGLDEKSRNAALGVIFGTRAVRGAIDLYQLGKTGVDQWTQAVNDSGIAAKTSNEKLNNLAGDVKKLGGSLSAMAIQSSGAATGGLRTLTKGATDTVNAFNDLPSGIGETVEVMAGLSGASLLAGSGLLKVRGSIKQMQAAMEAAGPVGGRLSKVVGGFTKWGGYTALAATALFGLYDVIHHFTAKPKADIDKLTESIANLGQTGVASGELTKAYGSDLKTLVSDASKIKQVNDDLATLGKTTAGLNALQAGYAQHIAGIRQSVEPQQIKSAVQDFKDLDAALTATVSNGNAQAASAAYQQISQKLLQMGYGVDFVNSLFPTYNKNASQAALDASSLSKGFGTVTEQTQLMNGTLSDAITQLGGVDKAFDALNGAAESDLKAQSDMQAAFDSAEATVAKYGETVKKGTHSIDLNTAAGRSNLGALTSIIDTTKAASQATYDHTQSVSKANDVIAAGRKEFIALATKILGSSKAAEALANALFKIPPMTKASVSAPGLDATLLKVNEVNKVVRNLNGKHVTIYFKASGDSVVLGTGQKFNRWGGLYEHAATGALRDARVYSAAGAGARYAFAEPSTGGEAFIPKRGNYGRSMSILDHAAGWYGARVMPASGGQPVALPPIQVVVVGGPDLGGKVIEGLRFEVQWRGGDVQKVIGKQR